MSNFMRLCGQSRLFSQIFVINFESLLCRNGSRWYIRVSGYLMSLDGIPCVKKHWMPDGADAVTNAILPQVDNSKQALHQTFTRVTVVKKRNEWVENGRTLGVHRNQAQQRTINRQPNKEECSLAWTYVSLYAFDLRRLNVANNIQINLRTTEKSTLQVKWLTILQRIHTQFLSKPIDIKQYNEYLYSIYKLNDKSMLRAIKNYNNVVWLPPPLAHFYRRYITVTETMDIVTNFSCKLKRFLHCTLVEMDMKVCLLIYQLAY